MVRNVKPRARSWNFGATVAANRRQFWTLTILTMFIEAWALMILLGIFAGYLTIPGLAIGYWASFGVGFLWGTAKGSVVTVRDYW